MRRVGTGAMVKEQIPILSRANFKKSAGKIIFLVTYLLPLAVSH